ncbi:MAG: carbamate kinase [Odoribacter sp.]|uniref:carbamate kinase n=1 Tax=Bacteroides fluxus TaxID=626930 RepID=UPI0023F53050|nr:carbamate kinase [Bacteroides fluxus]MCI5707495.1 carbamate kinase [Odoribacter sp.]MDY3033470.1 carbamate kinase [Odoribacter sp.]
MEKKKLAVVALGGNAILRGNQKGTVEEQNKNVRDTMENLVYLIKEGYNLIITHGNGPQVGNILMSDDAGVKMYDLPPMTLDMCVAYSQGQIAYMIERNLRNVMKEHGLERNVMSIVTPVVVDEHDPALKNPTKRVGRIYSREEADKLAAEHGWIFKEEIKANGGWRRVVPSPAPINVKNAELVERMAREGNIVITVGGGGIPVFEDEKGMLQPLEGVIDKDLASAMIGGLVKADELYILTDVPYIYKNYKQPNEEVLEVLDYADTKKYLEEGIFAEGSMAPKIRACLAFVEKGGDKAVITESTKLEDRRYGSKITMHYE